MRREAETVNDYMYRTQASGHHIQAHFQAALPYPIHLPHEHGSST